MRQVVLVPDLEGGGFTAIVPTLPGCTGEGNTMEAALESIAEAIKQHIEQLISDGQEVPEDRVPLRVAMVDAP